MKKFLLAVFLLAVCPMLRAQQDEKVIVWHDADQLPLYGKIIEGTSARYERLPAYLEGKVPKGLWDLGRDCAGMYLRFRTNSSQIKAKWQHLYGISMNHMTDTGTRGLDLYIWDGKKWVYAGSGRPNGKKESTSTLVSNMDGEMKECMLYLSLYDGIQHIEFGLEEGAVLEGPALDSPRRDLGPVVMYGTSILQGGCANRPGMAYTNIISRRIDRTVVNFGFSGNAHLEPEIAQTMAACENPAMYVLDFVPNCSVERIQEQARDFYDILRSAHSEVPIVFVELQLFANACFDTKSATSVPKCNAALRAVYEGIRKSGDRNVWYIDNVNLIGTDYEGTVDASHLTDVGMMRYADKVTPIIKKILKKSGQKAKKNELVPHGNNSY